MKCYYAHCQAIYDTPQEKRDIELLESLGFEVENPNTAKHKKEVKKMRDMFSPALGDTTNQASEMIMHYFADVVQECGVLAFRALPDGRIPAGIVTEMNVARNSAIPVIELPSGILKRSIGIEETREFLKEIGQR